MAASKRARAQEDEITAKSILQRTLLNSTLLLDSLAIGEIEAALKKANANKDVDPAALTTIYSLLVQQRSNIREQVKRNIHSFAVQSVSAETANQSDSSDEESSEDEASHSSAMPEKTRCSYKTVMEKLTDLEKEYGEDALTLEDELHALKSDLQTYSDELAALNLPTAQEEKSGNKKARQLTEAINSYVAAQEA